MRDYQVYSATMVSEVKSCDQLCQPRCTESSPDVRTSSNKIINKRQVLTIYTTIGPVYTVYMLSIYVIKRIYPTFGLMPNFRFNLFN